MGSIAAPPSRRVCSWLLIGGVRTASSAFLLAFAIDRSTQRYNISPPLFSTAFPHKLRGVADELMYRSVRLMSQLVVSAVLAVVCY